MHQRSDIFTVRNIFTLILLGVLIIGLYSYHNVNYRLSSSSTTLKSLKMQMEASDNQLRNAIKSKTACFKDVMQLRASTIDMKTKLSEAETELAKEKHDTASKLLRCSEEKKDIRSQLEKMQNEVQSLKEEDRNKVQKKKDEEEEKEKKLKEMTAEHELKVSRLKDEIADLQKDKAALQEKLQEALIRTSKSEGKKSEIKETTKKVEEDNSMRQVRPPVVNNPDRKVQPHADATKAPASPGTNKGDKESSNLLSAQQPSVPSLSDDKLAAKAKKHRRPKLKLPDYNASEGVVRMDEPKKVGMKRPGLNKEDEPKKDDFQKNDPKKDDLKKDQPAGLRKPQGGPGVDEEDKEGDKVNPLKEEKRGQQLDMPLPRDAAKQNKEPNQLPHPVGADLKLGGNQPRQIQPANNDDDDTGGGVPIY